MVISIVLLLFLIGHNTVFMWHRFQNFIQFYFASPVIIEVRNFLSHHIQVCRFFLSVKFAASLLAYLAGDKPQFFWRLATLLEGAGLAFDIIFEINSSYYSTKYQRNWWHSSLCYFSPVNHCATQNTGTGKTHANRQYKIIKKWLGGWMKGWKGSFMNCL